MATPPTTTWIIVVPEKTVYMVYALCSMEWTGPRNISEVGVRMRQRRHTNWRHPVVAPSKDVYHSSWHFYCYTRFQFARSRIHTRCFNSAKPSAHEMRARIKHFLSPIKTQWDCMCASRKLHLYWCVCLCLYFVECNRRRWRRRYTVWQFCWYRISDCFLMSEVSIK